MRHKFVEEKVFISPFVIDTIGISRPARIGVRHNNNHWGRLSSGNRLVGYVLYFAELNPSGLIIGVSVK